MNEAFEGVSNTKSATDIQAGDFLKIALVGKQKVGKSWMAATMPGPVLIYDFDERAESIGTLPESLKQNIAVKTLADKAQSKPTTFAELESDIEKFKYRKQNNKPIPASFVFDSVTYLQKAILNMAFNNGLAYRPLKISPTTSILVSKNWDAVNTVVAAVNYLITEFSSLGNICFVFHEKAEKDYTESKPDAAAYTDQVTVDPQFLATVLSRFNEVYRIQIDSAQKYKVTCRPKFEFTASTTLLIDAEEAPNITDLLKKHRERLAKQQQVKPILVANN